MNKKWYYWDIFESMNISELQSVQRSNRKYLQKGGELYLQFRIYFINRVIRDLIPTIAIMGAVSTIISIISDMRQEG